MRKKQFWRVYLPHNDAEYQQIVEILDQLIDEVGNDETHSLASLMEIIGTLIEVYEERNVPELSDEANE